MHGLIDAEQVAIVGYSRGGFGALASAGAGYNKQSPIGKTFVPGGHFESRTAASAEYEKSQGKEVKAIVAIAPWGEQPPFSVWDSDSLGRIRIPAAKP